MSNGTIECNITDERFVGLLEEDYNSALYNGYRIISQTREEERNADVYIYQKNGSTQKKIITYQLNSDTTEYWVEERYLKDSDVVPYEVHVFGKTDTANFRVFIRNIEERPTVEFLTSFSVTPYTE